MKKNIYPGSKIDNFFGQARETPPIMGLGEVRNLISSGRTVKNTPKRFRLWKISGIGLVVIFALITLYLSTQNNKTKTTVKATETVNNMAKRVPVAEPKTNEAIVAADVKNKKNALVENNALPPDNNPAPPTLIPAKTNTQTEKNNYRRKEDYYNPKPPVNNDEEWTEKAESGKLKGWYLAGPHAGLFDYGADPDEHYSGNNSAFIESRKSTYKSAWLTQKISAAEYAGKRIRLTAEIKCKQSRHPWAGLFLSAVGNNYKEIRYDNLFDKNLKNTNSWNKCEVVMDIPADCSFITFGMYKAYTGKAWIDSVGIEIVNNSVPLTKKSIPEATDTLANIIHPKGLTEKAPGIDSSSKFDFNTKGHLPGNARKTPVNLDFEE